MNSIVELTDLRSITRRSDKCVTHVDLYDRKECRLTPWLIFGEAQMRIDEPRYGGRIVWLESYLASGVTDFEHDSAYALRLSLVGLEFRDIAYHYARFNAIIDPDGDNFHVPMPGYNPMQEKGALMCEDCKEPHIIVPEGFYVPRFNRELYAAVKGMTVEISIGCA